jgi:hypothetical protein
MYHILGNKVSLKKYKKINCILLDHNGIKLNINTKIEYRDYTHAWGLDKKLLKDQ